MDDAGGVNPYEHLAFPRTGLLRLVVGERLGATAGAQTNRLHAPLQKHLWAEREFDPIFGHFQRNTQILGLIRPFAGEKPDKGGVMEKFLLTRSAT
jgi:hypothetical protein